MGQNYFNRADARDAYATVDVPLLQRAIAAFGRRSMSKQV